MDADIVSKRSANRQDRSVRRDPAPEILFGDATLLRIAINSSRCKHRYASCVLAFAASDFDVEAFNAGDPDARFAVDLAFRLWRDTALAGIPPIAHPPIYVTTHTHTGALEVNIAVPRLIMGPDGRQRAFNPAPPGRVSQETWDAMRDLLNQKFGWADPDDPTRHRMMILPDWMLKVDAESNRAGVISSKGLRRRVMDEITAELAAGQIHDRPSLLGWLEGRAEATGFVVQNITSKSITIGVKDAAPKDRICLRGKVFEECFGRVCEDGIAQSHAAGRTERSRVLSTAAERLQALWQRRAAFNRCRYGMDRWPPQEFSAAKYQTAQPGDNALIIPLRHHLHILSKGSTFNGNKTHPDGARTARHIGGDDIGSTNARQDAEPEDRRLDAADTAARNVSHDLVQLTEPILAERLLNTLRGRIKRLTSAIRGRLTLKRVYAAFSDVFLRTLTDTKSALEAYNDQLTQETRSRQSDRTTPEGADRPDSTATRLVGGQLRRDDRTSRRGNRGFGRNSLQPAKDRQDDEQGTQQPVPGFGNQVQNHRNRSTETIAVTDRSARLVRRTAAVDSRASLLRYLRAMIHDFEDGAEVGLQFTAGATVWPPSLEIDVEPVFKKSTAELVTAVSVCRLTCRSTQIEKIVSVLRQAVEAGLIREITVGPTATTCLSEAMSLSLQSQGAKPDCGGPGLLH
ncbi:hypothetical protein ACG74X_19455 [Marivita sp. S0852]|uniref:hypothetical protein n=1 Tax=Marivita sp. S0852 TaxID=3373893 RepID=UPI0039819E5F